jgi:hypothetical protein
MRWWWPKSVSVVAPLLREEDVEGLGPANRRRRKSKEDDFRPQREARLKALELFSDWNKSFEFKIKGFEYFQINFQMKFGLEPN